MSNDYSAEWFDTFLSTIPPEQTARESDFLARNLFQPAYTTVLDLGCGMGRPARAVRARVSGDGGRYESYRHFYETRQGELTPERAGRTVGETKWLEGNRLHVTLDYGAVQDRFEWQIFYPDEIAALAARYGLREILRCTGFDETQVPNAEMPRMQFVFEKSS